MSEKCRAWVVVAMPLLALPTGGVDTMRAVGQTLRRAPGFIVPEAPTSFDQSSPIQPGGHASLVWPASVHRSPPSTRLRPKRRRATGPEPTPRALQYDDPEVQPEPAALASYNGETSAESEPPSREDTQCSLFTRGESGRGSPPAVVVGGFGGSSTRLVAELLGAAGVYMAEHSSLSLDSVATRSTHCNLNRAEDIHARLGTRSRGAPLGASTPAAATAAQAPALASSSWMRGDPAAVLLAGPEATVGESPAGASSAVGYAWGGPERLHLSCLATAFDDDVGKWAAPENGCAWGVKEPRLMYYANLVHAKGTCFHFSIH